uniref:NADH dehydrogenase subunit 9 n=1 Tax=Pseudourostyla cristata TaxID=293816 RepID=A0A4P9JLD8_9SPIT|nr:NADH dehydrogenase subunit 9 [Pseudourostyla cristata]
MSSFFYSTQLTDIFCYETPINLNTINNDKTGNNNLTIVPTTIIVYNLHIILPQQRVFLIILNTIKTILTKNVNKISTLASITELFNNANWLERENTELHGVVFSNKKDTRNLMLQYGDASTPLIKTFPSIGIREIYYDSVTDSLIQTTPTIQF